MGLGLYSVTLSVLTTATTGCLSGESTTPSGQGGSGGGTTSAATTSSGGTTSAATTGGGTTSAATTGAGGASCPADCGPAGCCQDHCCALEPSNAAAVGLLEPNGMTLTAPNGEFDTSLDCTSPALLGACKTVTQPGAPQICVCRADDITINALTIKGERALAILAYGTVTVDTLIVTPGAGAKSSYAAETGELKGGRGGSHATAGGNAGAAPVYGNAALAPLVGGMDGQDASMFGGRGGGAVQISAGKSIVVNGGINASGGGGTSMPTVGEGLGGPGGGSGGAILLEAPTITLAGVLAANGGAGGGGWSLNWGPGAPGQDGLLGTTQANGGAAESGYGCALSGYTTGGDGGDGAAGSSAGASGEASSVVSCLPVEKLGEGGGGGGLGRIRINTKAGCDCGGALSGSASFGTVTLK